MTNVTQIFSAIEQGDPSAAEQLLPLVYGELRKLSAQKMAQEALGQTLLATALVHEAYLRLVFEEMELPLVAPGDDILAMDEALTRLSQERPEKAELVKLHCFAGLTVDDAAHAIGVSPATAER